MLIICHFSLANLRANTLAYLTECFSTDIDCQIKRLYTFCVNEAIKSNLSQTHVIISELCNAFNLFSPLSEYHLLLSTLRFFPLRDWCLLKRMCHCNLCFLKYHIISGKLSLITQFKKITFPRSGLWLCGPTEGIKSSSHTHKRCERRNYGSVN